MVVSNVSNLFRDRSQEILELFKQTGDTCDFYEEYEVRLCYNSVTKYQKRKEEICSEDVLSYEDFKKLYFIAIDEEHYILSNDLSTLRIISTMWLKLSQINTSDSQTER